MFDIQTRTQHYSNFKPLKRISQSYNLGECDVMKECSHVTTME